MIQIRRNITLEDPNITRIQIMKLFDMYIQFCKSLFGKYGVYDNSYMVIQEIIINQTYMHLHDNK